MIKVQVLPSLITIGNLLCGFFAICISASFLRTEQFSDPNTIDHVAYQFLNIFRKEGIKDFLHQDKQLLHISMGLIFLGMVFDAFDGKVARMTNHVTEFGAELDSLADAITFGVAPAFLAVVMLHVTNADSDKFKVIYLIPSVFMICAVLRLARYNVERNDPSKDKGYFKGLPTPAGAAAIVSLIWLEVTYAPFSTAIFKYVLLISCVVIGLLEVSNIKYLHLAQKILKEPKSIYFIALLMVVLYVLSNYFVTSVFVLSYGYVIICTALDIKERIKNKRLASAFEDDTDGVV